jgi:iron complex transport system permease protein
MTAIATAPGVIEEGRHASSRRHGRLLPLLAILVGLGASVVGVGLGVVIGTIDIPLEQVWRSISHELLGVPLEVGTERAHSVVWELRLPRVILAYVAGAGLAIAGVLMQGMLRNPLVSAFTLGVSPAAAFGAAIVILLTQGSIGSSSPLVIASALTCALIVAGIVLGLGTSKSLMTATLLLLGVAFTQLFESLTAGMQFVADENTLAAIVRWTFGSVNSATWIDVQIVAAVVIAALPVVLWNAGSLNAVAFAGDDAARSLGVNVDFLRVFLIVIGVVLAAVVVSFCGIIGFVGLVAPHIGRMIIGTDHRYLLVFAAIIGGLLLLFADTVGRTVLAPAVIPVGIVVAFLGGPVFIYLILTRRSML